MRLGLPPGSRVFHGLLLHYEDDQPVQYEDRYVNPAVAPGFLEQDFSATTPTEYLIRMALVEQIEHTVRAVQVSEPVRPCLQSIPGSPAGN